ncbi:MAG: nucleoside deaminase [Bacteroidia bacterium]|nr:nucleoside deaminase [Bacteroidia bacterium]
MENTYNPLFMQRAIELSEIAYKSGKGLPIGCVIVRDGTVIGEGHNEIFIRKNPTAHGEMVAIEDACRKLNDLQLEGCDIYTTLEPCPMCFGAIYWSKLKNVYFANSREEASYAGFDDSFIFDQLHLKGSKQRIPMHHVKNEIAFKVLENWKSENLPASQPWTNNSNDKN